MALVAALLAAGVGSVTLRASSTDLAADFTLSADQTTVGVAVGAQAVLAVTVSPVGSFTGPVSLSVSGAPVGAAVAITPNPALPGIPAIVSVLVGGSTPAGSYTLTITGTSNGTSHSITVQLVVSLATGFTMVLNPAAATVVDGGATDYTLTVNRGLLTGPVTLKLSGVPQYATATVSPSLSLLGSTATVHVSTATNVVPGTYRLTVSGSALLASASASAYLVVVPQRYPDFPISGNLDRTLAPGVTGRLDLALTNPFSSALTVTTLNVAVSGTNKSGCGASNYSVTQYGGSYPLTVPASSTRTLSQLGVTAANLPTVTMVDLPTNQDACKNATVSLAYSGSGNGA